jgi:hypothetical protein
MHDALLEGGDGGFGAILHDELGEEGVEVRPHVVLAHEQRGADLPVAVLSPSDLLPAITEVLAEGPFVSPTLTV